MKYFSMRSLQTILIFIIVVSAYGNASIDKMEHYSTMTGEELAKLIMVDTDQELDIHNARVTSGVFPPGNGLTIRRPINFYYCLFDSTIYIVGNTFLNDVSFTHCIFSGECLFIANKFTGSADFSFNEFMSQVGFTSSTFLMDVSLQYSVFSGAANFIGCRFFGTVGFQSTRWRDQLWLANSIANPGVIMDFSGAKWEAVQTDKHGKPEPVLFMNDMDYDRLWFPVADIAIPRPLLGFVEGTTFPEIQRTYGKYLNHLKSEGRYADYDVLFTEFHDLERKHEWHSGQYLGAVMNWFMRMICGYGINPKRAFWCSIWIVLGFAVLYSIPWSYHQILPRYERDPENALTNPPYSLWNYQKRDKPVSPSSHHRKAALLWWHIIDIMRRIIFQIKFFPNFILFSLNTFCSVGYDNNYPIGKLRYLCMIELILGYITLTLFLVSMVNVLVR